MWNPFAIPLATSGFGPNTGYDLPSGDTEIYPSEQEPDFTGLSGGVSYRSNSADLFDGTGLGYLNNPGPESIPTFQAPAPGSVDLSAARYDNGIPGTDRIIHSDGPVSGDGTEFNDGRAVLNTPNPGYAGPVTGGPDYAQTAAANYFASQAQQYSAQASAEALLVTF